MESTVPTEGGFSRDDSAVDAEPTPKRRGTAEVWLERGAQVGRYVVLRELGRGGMGVVYAAYDPELDRKVAVKLIHTGGRNAKRQMAARARLLREAQSLARLSHPSVVTVLDVGTFEDRVFVAMEFVDGWTLGEWLKAGQRSWREVLNVLRSAASGLEAAHLAGLVHRDFKPDNVMIRRDGRVVVLDFGLARQASADDNSGSSFGKDVPEDTVDDVVSGPRSGEASFNVSLTRTGGVMGTPAYMAPEQHLGLPTDARSDQFSFCVTLYEALYGSRPFGNGRPATLAFNISHGRIRPPPRDAKVPKWLRRVLLRGLQADPEERYPTMAALIEALTRDPWRGRWMALGGAAVLSMGLAGYGAFMGSAADDESVCRGGERRLAPAWNDARRATVQRALLATGKSFATDVARRVADDIDEYSRSWLVGYSDACEATAVHHEQSTGMLDLRMTCLDRSLKQLSAVVDVLSESNTDVLAQAVDAVQALPDLEHCADLEALQLDDKVPRPRDPAQAERFEQLFARAKALNDLGSHQQAVQAVDEALAIAERLDHSPSMARVLLLAASVQQLDHEWNRMEDTLRRAAIAADRAHDDVSRSTAMMRLAEVAATRDPKSAAPREWLAAGAAAVERAGSPLRLRAALEQVRGAVEMGRGNMAAAEQHYASALAMFEIEYDANDVALVKPLFDLANVQVRTGDYERGRVTTVRALELQEGHYGADHPQLAIIINSLATIDLQTGRLEEALAGYQRVLELHRERYGEEHPKIAGVLNNIGIAYDRLFRTEEAVAALQESIRLLEARVGPDDLDLTPPLENIANAYQQVREVEKARENYQRALKIKLKHMGESHPQVAATLANMARSYYFEGEHGEAKRLLDRALSIWNDKLEPNHVYFGFANVALGDVAYAQGRYADALAHFERARDLGREAVGEKHADYAYALGGVGMSRARLGETQEGIRVLEQALAIQKTAESERGSVERIQFALARELAVSDLPRALAYARSVRATLRQQLPGSHELVQVEKWLAEHTRSHSRSRR